MKTLKTMMMGLALTLALGVAGAAPKTHHTSPTKDEVIDTYVNAVVRGNTDGINNAIDDDAQFYTVHSDRVSQLNKGQMIAYLKANPGVDQDCQCSSTVLQDTDDTFVKKEEIRYNGVTRTDVI